MGRPGPRTVNRYSEQFKATAVRLSQLPGVKVSEAANSLHIHPFMLSKWRKQARAGADNHWHESLNSTGNNVTLSS
jgi:transposase